MFRQLPTLEQAIFHKKNPTVLSKIRRLTDDSKTKVENNIVKDPKFLEKTFNIMRNSSNEKNKAVTKKVTIDKKSIIQKYKSNLGNKLDITT